MRRGKQSNKTELLFSLCISVQTQWLPHRYLQFCHTCNLFVKDRSTSFCFMAVTSGSFDYIGADKDNLKTPLNILWCAAIHAKQAHESYGTVTFKPCSLFLNIFKEIKIKHEKISREWILLQILKVFCYKTHLHNARGNFHLFYFYSSVTVLLCNECYDWKAKIGDSSYCEYPRGYTKRETLLQTGSIKPAHRNSILFTHNCL